MSDEKEPKEKAIRLIWDSPDDRPAFSNHVHVSHVGGHEFHIVFGYTEPPLIHGLTEEEIDNLPETLPIKPVANLVITPEMMRALVSVLTDNLEKYEENKKGE